MHSSSPSPHSGGGSTRSPPFQGMVYPEGRGWGGVKEIYGAGLRGGGTGLMGRKGWGHRRGRHDGEGGVAKGAWGGQ